MFKCLCLFAIVNTEAIKVTPSFRLGEEVGEALSEEISKGTADFSTLNNVNSENTPSLNSPLFKAVQAMNEKYASKMPESESFLQLQRPILNLHVAETPQASSISTEVSQALSNLEQDEVTRMERLARAGSSGSFLQVKDDIQREVVDIAGAKQMSEYYTGLLSNGGDAARTGIIGLLKLAGTVPNAHALLNLSPGVIGKASELASRESTPDQLRNLCGSLITFITGMPIAFQSSDAVTGSYGHTNIIVPSPSRVYGPDMVMSEIGMGAHASDVV